MKIPFFALLVLGIFAACFFMAQALLFATGAPQQAAAAAIACGFVVIPYCLLKGIGEVFG